MYSKQVKNVVNYYKNRIKFELRYHSFYQQIIKETAFLSNKSVINQRFWHILNNTKKIPKCLECDNRVKWYRDKRYRNYCSVKCSRNSKKVQDKFKQTCLDRYGVNHPFQSKIVQDKYKQTNLKKYGVEYPLQSEKVYNKIKQTNLKRYGVESPLESKVIQDKIKQTNLKRYGAESPLESKVIQDKIKQTNLKRYGAEYPSQSITIYNCVKQTCLDKYGVEYHTQRHLSQDTLTKLKDKEWLIHQHRNLKKPLTQMAKELGMGNGTALGKRFKKYNIEVLTSSSSEGEKELINFIRSIYSKIILTNSFKIISPYELDIYLPDIKLAIEFNGLYWHSYEVKQDINYHFNKSKLCSDKDIRLIHIFEDEWINNKDEIKRWIKKYLFDNDYITKDVLIKDLNNQKKLNLSLNWPININKLEELGYILDNRLEPEEQLLSLDKTYHKIYDCGKVIYKREY